MFDVAGNSVPARTLVSIPEIAFRVDIAGERQRTSPWQQDLQKDRQKGNKK